MSNYNRPPQRTYPPLLGMPAGLLDKTGRMIHFGDVLHFDPREWGSDDCYFRFEFYGGDVHCCGAPSEMPEWCRVVETWEGVRV